MNKGFERCCTFLAEMMEKYGVQVLRDITVEIQYESETWCDDAEGKRLRYEAYAEIKDYVLKGNGLKVSNLYISQIIRKCGIEVEENYNLPKSEDSRQPQRPEEKEKAI